ncbi:hypothetical protein [Tropicibacter sp. S64]|uniref:hypothetical protein n=1 Tax=Tropicibacter sp. S64 TaxID=3415122 RepID=UPI003C798BDF
MSTHHRVVYRHRIAMGWPLDPVFRVPANRVDRPHQIRTMVREGPLAFLQSLPGGGNRNTATQNHPRASAGAADLLPFPTRRA